MMRSYERSRHQWINRIRLMSYSRRNRGLLPTDLTNLSDDLKPASGEIYNACKAFLNLTNPGNNARTFMRDTLTPLVGQDTQVYQKMSQDIFG